MFERLKKKREKAKTGKIVSMRVNGVSARCLNMRLYYDKDGVGRLEIYTREPEESLHFEQSELEINTTDSKRLVLTAAFDSAKKEGKIYHYLFTVLNYREFFA